MMGSTVSARPSASPSTISGMFVHELGHVVDGDSFVDQVIGTGLEHEVVGVAASA